MAWHRPSTLRCTPFQANQTQALRIAQPAAAEAPTKLVNCPDNHGGELLAVRCPYARRAAGVLCAFRSSSPASGEILSHTVRREHSGNGAKAHPLPRMRRAPRQIQPAQIRAAVREPAL